MRRIEHTSAEQARRRRLLFACAPLLGLLMAAAPKAHPPAHPADPLVLATAVVPHLKVSLRYATSNDFMHRAVYPKGARCWLRRSVARRLAKAARILWAEGYRLLAWDCYRPRSVQWAMWKIFPHPGYVANPATGSNHNRGTAVDITLLTRDGKPIEMPTDFDAFTTAAHLGDHSSSKAAQAHRAILHRAMRTAGFRGIHHEWWHFNAPHARSFAILDAPLVRRPPAPK